MDPEGQTMTITTAGRVVGALILSAFFLYGGGSFLVASADGGAVPLPRTSGSGQLLAGAALLLLNSVAVVVIGALAVRVLKDRHPRTAYVYLTTRAVENGQSAYWVAMVALGVGSIFFCRALWLTALLPRPLAMWGVVGIAIFALGGILEIAGYGVGLALSVPGGLFEVAAGSFLLARGFRCGTPRAAVAGPADHDRGRVDTAAGPVRSGAHAYDTALETAQE